MTRRQLRRHARRHPAIAAVVVLIGLVVIISIAVHLAGLIMMLAAVAAIAYAAGRNRRPVVRVTARRGPQPVQSRPPATARANTAPGPAEHTARITALTAERDQLAAEVDDLRGQLGALLLDLDDARASARAAWDAAAERPPAPKTTPQDDDGKRASLLADPFGGARPLGPYRQQGEPGD